MRYYVGVDGGGTKTAVCAADEGSSIGGDILFIECTPGEEIKQEDGSENGQGVLQRRHQLHGDEDEAVAKRKANQAHLRAGLHSCGEVRRNIGCAYRSEMYRKPGLLLYFL